MPLYDYKNIGCSETGCTEFIELFHGFNEKIETTICEKCGEPGELRKDIGWYFTLCDTHHKMCKNSKIKYIKQQKLTINCKLIHKVYRSDQGGIACAPGA
jgi:hypothetical protein